MLGVVWAILQPLALLAVFTTVFGVVLKVKWAGTSSQLEFALVLFAGLTIFSFFGECLVRSPRLIVERPNLVKKVVFPVEVLAWVNLGSPLFHLFTALGVWALFYAGVHGTLPWTLIFLPWVLLPLALISVAVGWFFGALGIYIRDLQQAMPPLSMAIMFLSPVFFDLAAVPEGARSWFLANPMTFIIEQARLVMLKTEVPRWGSLALATIAAYVVAWGALAFFLRAREDFADAL